jgi:MurNAc alpha-1-phosphate uridylyltransferase
MQAVILCGGQSTRLGELARGLPKSLIEVAGRPFIDWQLDRLQACGFTRVVLCIGYRGDQVRRYVGDGRQGLAVSYSDEGDAKLGTGGALRLACPLLDEEFLLTYGDSYLTADLAAPLRFLQLAVREFAVMSVWPETPGNVKVLGGQVQEVWDGWHQYGSATDYGAIAMRKRVVAGLLAGMEFPLNPILNSYAQIGRVRAHVVQERYHEIGSPEGLAETEAFLHSKKVFP